MRIRKISQSAATPGKIVNSPSDSTTETYSCNYTKDISAVVSPTEPTGNNKNKVWFKKGKNLFNENSVTKGYAINSDGSGGSSSVTNASDFIKVKAGKYTLSYDYSSLANQTGRGYCLYNENSTYLSGNTYDPSNRTTTFTIANDGYIRFSFDKNCTNIQLEQGQTATTYEAYVEPEIYTRNNNNVYEEFTTKDYDVLWSNSNHSASFAGQTVTLNKSINEYSYYEVLFKDYYGENSCISTGKIKIMKTYLESCRYRNQVRELTSISDTSATFGDGLIYQNYGSNTATTNNNINIPLEIIGYK